MPSGACGFGVRSHWPSGPHAFRSMWLCVSRVIGLLVHMTSGACGFVCHESLAYLVHMPSGACGFVCYESLAFWSTCLQEHVALCVTSHWPSGPHAFRSMWLCVSRVIGLLVHMPSGACGFGVTSHWPSDPHALRSMWLCVSRVIGLLVHMTSGACGFVCHESLAF